jgi:alpha-glucosidase
MNFNYEGDYPKTNLSSIGSIGNPNDLIAMPLVMKAGRSAYVCLSEAAITDYPGMYLIKAGSNSFKSRLVPNPNDNSVSAAGKTPFVTPWRMFMISNKPGGLVESNLVMNLNEPQAIDGSWIKPGKSLWDWWSGSTGFDANFGWGMNEKTFKYYIDFAAENNIQYVTIDAGWYGTVDPNNMSARANITQSIPEINIEGLTAYANSKGVGIIVWMMWNHLNDQMDEALNYYGRIGIKGIKTDFMNREDQQMVDFYHRVLKKAADNRLLVNFHGAYKPDGLNRTYPNLITREAVLGAEYSKWDKNYPNPTYNVTIPFTRMLLGAMDYTPGGMRNTAPNDATVNYNLPIARGTRVHQLASLVVFESPLQTLSESPEVYKNSTDFAFIKQCPASWDVTKVLAGSIGEYIVIARKSGNNWYVGAMTNSEPRDLEINFNFLGAGTYTAEVYSDAADVDRNPSSAQISRESITKSDEVTIHLAPGGGLAIILRK